MSAVLFIIATLFCLKILSNLSVPYVLAFQYLKSQGQDKNGISLMLEVEIALWLLLFLLSCVSNGPTWLDEPRNVVIWGLGAILASYIHFYVAAIALVGGTKAVSMWFKKPKPHQTPFGEFIKKGGVWESYIEVEGEEILIITDDVSAQPNPKLLHIIPLLQQNLSYFERMARQSVQTLSSEHALDSVSIDNINPQVDFSLFFLSIEKFFPEMVVIVGFKDNKISDWWGSD